ncbi:MAG: PAS domain S-box protein [Lysobacteraceae bacterium]|nr:MAG: PAS domain S-box protein [Xanthomonadaceae bacterium]
MNEAVAALLLESIPDAVIVADAEGSIIHWSEGARSLFGYATDEALGHSIVELIVPDDQQAVERRILGDVIGEGSAIRESVRRRKDGSLLCVDISNTTLPAIDARGPLVLSVEKDVTHIKVLRDAKVMEARFRELLESTPDGIVMTNATGFIVLANSQAEKLFGYDAGDLRGKPVDMLLPEPLRRAHVGHRSQYFLQPRKRAMGSGLDLSGLRKDGTEFPLEISLSPLHTEDGSFVLSAIRDISERKQIQRALQETNAELASANQAKDHFLASMSHELRTPLNAIIGFTGILLMKLPGPLTADQEKQLKTVQGSAKHLLALINDLLDVAKIASGKVELRREPVDCNALVEDIAATLRPQAESKGIELLLELPAPPLLFDSDHRALSQIVINLASNAIKFTERGHVRLSVAAVGAPGAGGRCAEISVVDTGVGISERDQAKLFDAFSRVEADPSKPTEGTGLGLYLSRKLVHALGGTVTCVSARGSGSCFSISIPMD